MLIFVSGLLASSFTWPQADRTNHHEAQELGILDFGVKYRGRGKGSELRQNRGLIYRRGQVVLFGGCLHISIVVFGIRVIFFIPDQDVAGLAFQFTAQSLKR